MDRMIIGVTFIIVGEGDKGVVGVEAAFEYQSMGPLPPLVYAAGDALATAKCFAVVGVWIRAIHLTSGIRCGCGVRALRGGGLWSLFGGWVSGGEMSGDDVPFIYLLYLRPRGMRSL